MLYLRFTHSSTLSWWFWALPLAASRVRPGSADSIENKKARGVATPVPKSGSHKLHKKRRTQRRSLLTTPSPIDFLPRENCKSHHLSDKYSQSNIILTMISMFLVMNRNRCVWLVITDFKPLFFSLSKAVDSLKGCKYWMIPLKKKSFQKVVAWCNWRCNYVCCFIHETRN